MTYGPAEAAAWAAVADAAQASGEFLDVPDFLDRSTRSAIAPELLAAYRAPAGSGTDTPKRLTRRQRFASAGRRFRAGEVSVAGLLRTSAWIVLKSHRVEPSVPKSPASVDAAKVVRGLIEADRLDDAYVLGRSLAGKAVDQRLLKQLLHTQTQRGAISSALTIRRRLGVIRKQARDPETRQLEGRIRAMSGWHPRLPGSPVDIEPVAPNVVLHLTDASVPHVLDPHTAGRHRALLAARDAGLEPVVLTRPGFPRNVGIDHAPAVETVEGIAHRRLDLGQIEVENEPIDEWLERFALLAYQQMRAVRPAVIHVGATTRSYELALVGLALREKTGLPLVYEVHSPVEGSWTEGLAREQRGESLVRRRAVEIMCMERASAVITSTDAIRAEILATGIAPKRVTVIPDDIESEGGEPLARSTYRAVIDALVAGQVVQHAR